MAKINPQKKIQHQRTEDELRAALSAFFHRKPQLSTPPQDDDSDVVLADGIEELLELRALRERVRGFVAVMGPELARR